MDLTVSNITFEGRKNPQLHLKRKQLKRIRAKEAELVDRCKILQADCEALELPLKKVTPLAYDNPKAPIASKLWKLLFDAQYNAFYGSYSDYKTAKKLFAKEAVKNLDVLPYVNSPFQIRGPISRFSKIGRNITKNQILDAFRIKTPEEKQLIEFNKDLARNKAMHRTLGINY